MNYTKVTTHKKRMVVPIINIEVRGRLNLLFAFLGALVVFFVLLIFKVYIALTGAITTFAFLTIYLNELDDENNSILYKKYIKIIHNSNMISICWFDQEKSRITTQKKQQCNIVNINNYRSKNV